MLHITKHENHMAVRDNSGTALATYGFTTYRGMAQAERKAKAYVQAEKMRAAYAAARAIVQAGKCPDCGRAIKRNTSLAGWWQCEQFGASIFRKDPQQPACPWQTFTE